MSRPPLPRTAAPESVPLVTVNRPVPIVRGDDIVPPVIVAVPAPEMVRMGVPVLLSTLPLDNAKLLTVFAKLFRSNVPPLTITALAAFSVVVVPNFSVPAVSVTVPTNAGLAADSVNGEAPFSVTFVTSAPSAPLIVVRPLPPPLLVIVPVLLMPPAPNVTVAVPVLVIVMLPAPETAPLTVAVPVAGLMSRPPLPRTAAAETVPPLTVAVPAPPIVSVPPPVPWTVPLVTLRLPTVLLKLFRSNVPPLTTRPLTVLIWLACKSFARPVPLTVRFPAMDSPPVVFKSSSPALTVVKPL